MLLLLKFHSFLQKDILFGCVETQASYEESKHILKERRRILKHASQ
jgi:hypothetical protein